MLGASRKEVQWSKGLETINSLFVPSFIVPGDLELPVSGKWAEDELWERSAYLCAVRLRRSSLSGRVPEGKGGAGEARFLKLQAPKFRNV